MREIIFKSYYSIILGAGLAADLLWVILVNTQPCSDFLYYHNLARNIALGGDWGDTYTTVGYPIALSLFYWLFGAHLWVAKALNICLSFANNLLVLRILRLSAIPERGRKFAFLLFVFFPANIFYNSIVGTEIMFTTGLLLATNLYLSEIKFKYLLIGFLAGLETMIKPFFPAYFLAIFLSDLLGKRKTLGQSLLNGLLALLICTLTLSPWLYRNYKLFGEFTYVSNNGGINLYINSNSQNHTGGWMPAEQVENSLVLTPQYKAASMTERNRMLTRAAEQWIVSHPKEYLVLMGKRLVRTFLLQGDLEYSLNGAGFGAGSTKLLFTLTELVRAPVYFLGLLGILLYAGMVLKGLFKGKELDGTVFYLFITFCMFACIYSLTEGQTRYSFPAIFILIFFFQALVLEQRKSFSLAGWDTAGTGKPSL